MKHKTAPAAWGSALAELTGERRRAVDFLLDHLPQSDLDCYPPDLFLRFTDHALAVREAAPWCGALDWEIFAHYVLFPRVNDEDLSFHRETFHASLWPRVRDLPTQEDRVLEVNRWCREHAAYQAQDQRTASPLTVYRCGSGRCGEESAFLVSALRSVGIPARQVYAPRWSHCDDNHAWVEALCGGTWRFLGACEPEPVLDRGWFTTAASRAVLVHSRVFGTGTHPLHGTPLGPQGQVSWFNQTARYASVEPYAFHVRAGGRPAPGAEVELQILNEASFHTIAVLTADETGTARAELGRGSVHVLARWNGLTAEGDCEGAALTLQLTPPETGETPWVDFDVHAPADRRPAPAVLSGELKALRAETHRRGDELRLARQAGYSEPGPGGWEDLRRTALGNWGEIRRFLEGGGKDRERLVRTLSPKDLRDVTQDVLEDHFARLPPWPQEIPQEIYWKYTACPRIALEPLRPWRGTLARWLEGWTGAPAQLWDRVQGALETRPPAYGNLYWSPEGALAGGGCDEKSKGLFFIAALRTLGLPARLRPLDGEPEYWAAEGFRPVGPEETGTLQLSRPQGQVLRRGQDWTLSRWTGDGWQALSPAERWADGGLTLELPTGRYRILTTVRLPSGDQLASRREWELSPSGTRTCALSLRPWALDDLLTSQELPVLSAKTLEGAPVPDLFRDVRGPVLVLWLEEGAEPTEHLLNELLDHRQAVEDLPAEILFLLRGRDSLSQPTLAKALAAFPRIRVLLDDWAYDLEAVARHLGRNPDAPPLAVVCDGAGRAVYSDCGYRVGSAELLLKVAAWVCGEKKRGRYLDRRGIS